MSVENFKLGKLPPDESKPKLSLGKFLLAEAPASPAVVDWMSEIDNWPLHMNDRVGCCTIVSQAHALLALSHYGSKNNVSVTDQDVIHAYSDVSGYDPKTGLHDDGAYVQDALDHWRKVGLGGHKIVAFAKVDVHNQAEVDAAINIFGTLILGIALPVTAQDQTGPGRVWDYVAGDNARYSWGGHAVATGLYDRGAGKRRVSTWGGVQDMSQAFWNHYVDEAWVVITQEWLDANGLTPGGIDLYKLGEDFAELTGESNPFPAPAPAPEPVPTPDPVVPAADPADVILAAAAHEWLRKKRRGDNRLFAGFVQKWLQSKGL